jgi:hypothetical protein
MVLLHLKSPTRQLVHKLNTIPLRANLQLQRRLPTIKTPKEGATQPMPLATVIKIIPHLITTPQDTEARQAARPRHRQKVMATPTPIPTTIKETKNMESLVVIQHLSTIGLTRLTGRPSRNAMEQTISVWVPRACPMFLTGDVVIWNFRASPTVTAASIWDPGASATLTRMATVFTRAQAQALTNMHQGTQTHRAIRQPRPLNTRPTRTSIITTRTQTMVISTLQAKRQHTKKRRILIVISTLQAKRQHKEKHPILITHPNERTLHITTLLRHMYTQASLRAILLPRPCMEHSMLLPGCRQPTRPRLIQKRHPQASSARLDLWSHVQLTLFVLLLYLAQLMT